MILSRFSSCKRLRQRAMPSPPNKAELSVGRTSVCAVGALACCCCHKRKAVESPMTSTVKWQCTTTAASVRLGKFNRCVVLLAFFEDAIFNHRAPVIAVKHHEGI